MSYKARVYLTFVVLMSSLCALVLFVETIRSYQERESFLVQRAQILAETQATALAVPVWNFDEDTIKSIMMSLSLDPDFAGVEISLSDGSLKSVRPKASKAGLTAARRDIYSPEEAPGGEPEIIGAVHLHLSRSRLDAYLRDRSIEGVVILFALILATVTVVYIVLQSMVRPLNQLSQTMAHLSKNRYAVEIPHTGRDDEIGTVARTIEVFKRNGLELFDLRTSLERKIEEQTCALVVAKEEAEAGYRAKSEFLPTMSHEVRTPLNGVIGMANLLLDTELSSEQRQYAEIVCRSGVGLLSIINDILDFSKIEAGKLEMENVDFELRTVVEDVLELMAERAHAKGLELGNLIEVGTPSWVAGDPGRLRQVLTNLVGNAVKFTASGEVVVRVFPQTHENDDHSVLRFEVNDSGIGIRAADQSRLFNSFTQADSSTTRKYGGTGLGLAISKNLVHLMGGDIGVESEAGRGSTFWFTARLKSRAAPSDEPAPPPVALSGRGVLCVDDNATCLHFLETQLTVWGMQVTCAENGRDALEFLSSPEGRSSVDIVILDHQMPDMNGVELARAISSNPAFAEIPLMMLTAFGARGHLGEDHEDGPAAYLTKPIRQKKLLERLLTSISKKCSTPTPQSVPRERLQKYTHDAGADVLVVEDDEVNQMVAIKLLKKLGHQVSVVENGLQAVEAVARHTHDLVLMDCQMPVMDGLEATAAIRRNESHAGVRLPIIAMTANAMQEDQDRCIAAGMDDYITKPVDFEKLSLVLEAWLPDERGQATTQLKVEGVPPVLPAGAPPPDAPDEALGHTPVFDQAAMHKRLMGDEELINKMTEVFLGDMPIQLDELRTQVAAGNVRRATSQAHKIKGAAASIGGMALSAQALIMEQAGKTGDLAAVCQEIPELERCFTQVKTAIEEVRI